ncbi:MAG: TIGR01777 family oxidoreductase [Verrucomicrobia bacterium]|nr:TIGR01777 family oxidoreductase [Verrucomicrobiota bacterium]
MPFSTFKRSVRIERPAATVFAWHERPGAFERLMPPWRRRGRFVHWEHRHYFESTPDGACVLTDEVSYRLPLGALGRVAGGALARRELARLFAYRQAVTKADLETTARYLSVRPMCFLIAGASGLVGRALIPFLRTQGYTVVRLVRRPAAGVDEVSWDPAAGRLDAQAFRGVDVVINLAGEGVADVRWSTERKKALLRSRVESTRTLVNAMGALARGAPFVFISASATGIYGDRGNETLTETSAPGAGFLAGVCEAWEREALAAEALGVRVVRLRTGIVLTPAGGVLAKLLPLFRLGAGGRLASGRMWMSWIAIDDLVGAIYHAVLDRRCDGALNAVAPNAVTNAEFTRVLAQVLRRPALLPVPAAGLRVALGEMADETVLASARVVPGKLKGADYSFRHATLTEALRHLLGRA